MSTLLELTNKHFKDIVKERMPADRTAYLAPEQLPDIESRQVLALIRAVEEMFELKDARSKPLRTHIDDSRYVKCLD